MRRDMRRAHALLLALLLLGIAVLARVEGVWGGAWGLRLLILFITILFITILLMIENAVRAGHLGTRVVVVRSVFGMAVLVAFFGAMILLERLRLPEWSEFAALFVGALVLVVGVRRISIRLGLSTEDERRKWGAAEQAHAADGRRDG